jgi:hypothetical protein
MARRPTSQAATVRNRAADLRITMHEFKIDTIKAMQTILEEVCRHIPSNSSAARTFVATKILECAGSGDQTYEGLLAAGRRAVVDQFRRRS